MQLHGTLACRRSVAWLLASITLAQGRQHCWMAWTTHAHDHAQVQRRAGRVQPCFDRPAQLGPMQTLA